MKFNLQTSILLLMVPTMLTADDMILKWLKKKYKDAFRTVPELVEHYGYPIETHNVTTEDGYIITLHRIPYDVNSTNYKGPVVVVHGALSSSSAWVVSGPNTALAYILNNHGYDVWLPNLRGNIYSTAHTVLNENEKTFWDFSIHELGLYDLPAIIDNILNMTRRKSVPFIGFSMGAAASYILLSMKPEYNKKISVLISLAPAAACPNAKTFFRMVPMFVAQFREVLKWFNIGEVLNEYITNIEMKVRFCAEESITHEICKYLYFYSTGMSKEEVNNTNVAVIAGHYPGGTSRDILAHYGQGILSGRFAQFDYGKRENCKKYGSITPPLYPIQKVTVPSYIYYGEYDTFTTPEDIKTLSSKLGNVKKIICFPNCGHSDFIYGKTSDYKIYNPIVKILSLY